MIISNSGKMNRLKEKIKIALKIELIFDLIQGAVVSSLFKLEDLDKVLEKEDNIIKDNIKIYKLTREEILDNPYLKNINIEEEQIGNMVYSKKRRIRSNILSLYSEDVRDPDTYIIKKEYFIPEKVVDLPILHEKDKTVALMSIEPHETRTLSKFINEAYGNVLICGCGLGYTAYMLSLKENVNSITILEKNEDVIELFNNQVYKNIKDKEKISIIKCDANEYLNNNDLSIYDYINVDLWYDTFDMVYPYLKGLLLEEKYPNTHFTYWLEQSLLIEIQRELLSYIATGQFVGNVKQVSEVAKGTILVSHDLINNEESLNKFISFENIKKNMKEWSINNIDIIENMGRETEKQQEEYTSMMTKVLNKRI